MEEMNYWLNIATRIMEEQTKTLLRITTEQITSYTIQLEDAETRYLRKEIYDKKLYQLDLDIAKERQFRRDTELRMKKFETELKHQQLYDDFKERIIPETEQLHDEEFEEQEKTLLLISNCDILLQTQRDLQHRFKQLSLPQIIDTNTDTLTHRHIDTLVEQEIGLSEMSDEFSDVSVTNAAVIDTSKSLVSVRLNASIEMSVTNAVVTDVSDTVIQIENKEGLVSMVRNLNVPLTNVVVDDILIQKISEVTLQNFMLVDLCCTPYTLILTNKDVKLHLFGSFRSRSARFETRTSTIEKFEFLLMSLKSLAFDGGGQIRMTSWMSIPFDGRGRIRMTSWPSMPFDGGGWMRMTQ